MNSPNLNGMSAEKAAFLAQLMSETQSKNKNDMLPFLLSLSSRVNQSGLHFTDEETNTLIGQLTANLSPQDKQKVEMLRRFSQMLAGRNSPPKQS